MLWNVPLAETIHCCILLQLSCFYIKERWCAKSLCVIDNVANQCMDSSKRIAIYEQRHFLKALPPPPFAAMRRTILTPWMEQLQTGSVIKHW